MSPIPFRRRGKVRRSAFSAIALTAMAGTAAAQEPINVGFLWHMHQPIYVPYLDPAAAGSFFSFSVVDVHNSRFGPYTSWPANAVNAGSFLPYLGAQVSFSGSLIENLNTLESMNINGGMWSNWEGSYRAEQSDLSVLGNRRLEMVAFGYHHPLMPLLDERDTRMQIRLHKLVYGQTWSTPYSKGIFPPETAFSTRMIPALVAEGIDWAIVDNIHFDRASKGYPHTNASNLFAPNRADQINPNPADNGGRWVQLNNLWAPSQVSVPFGYQPHKAQHVDPETGAITKMTVFPAARYEGNEDGRGGYGAFLYDQVMDAYLQDNTDPNRPMFVLLHHDGDNFGGGSEGYYGHNFQNMVNWVQNDPDYEISTINDYLDRFPVPENAVIHVEDGSWAGADNGDPEFQKWLGGDRSAGGISPDVNSWAALTAAKNVVFTLDDFAPVDLDSTQEMLGVLNGTGNATQRAWYWLLVSQASDYWYWDGTEVWDSNVTRGSNQAVAIASAALDAAFVLDETPPTVFVPQRDPYNPGAFEFGSSPEPSDFEVWTLAYDYSGLQSITLKWRTDNDGENPINSIQNETYAGGPEVSAWNDIPMTAAAVPTPAGVLAATVKADRYGATITGQTNTLIDYYIEAVDTLGNIERSPIMHVWVGDGVTDPGGETGGPRVEIAPEQIVAGESVTVSYDASQGPVSSAPTVFAHVGFNGWNPTLSPDPAMSDPDGDNIWTLDIAVPSTAEELNIVFNDGNGSWDNNSGADWNFPVIGGTRPTGPGVDGALDDELYTEVASANGLTLHAAIAGSTLYLATNPASNGADRFVLIAQQPGSLQDAMWAKGGSVAAWDAFVGNEESNGFNGWFDQSGTTELALGQWLELSLDLAGEFGSMPDSVAVAVASYESSNGGSLRANEQLPAGNGDQNLDPAEYLTIEICSLTNSCCPADLDGDGERTVFDLITFLQNFTPNAACPADPACAVADLDDNNTIDVFDLIAFLQSFSEGC